MFLRLKCRLAQSHKFAVAALSLAAFVGLASAQGWFETVELGFLDQFFRWRSSTGEIDERILVVTIDENDITSAGQWPISDRMLSQLLLKIGEHEPASIGIDLYRNLPVEPGSAELVESFNTMPMVIGAERIIGEAVAPHKTLAELGQSASIDLVVDDDGRVRRGLLSVISSEAEVKHGLAAALALDYLSAQNIYPEASDPNGHSFSLQLGRSLITRFEGNDGGYVNADSGGYQVLMNYRRGHEQFESIGMTAVLNGELTEEKVRDRIVLIGSTAVSLPDLFYTPLHRERQISGVYIHAHLVSMILSAALDGEPFLKTIPTYLEWLWATSWAAVSLLASRSVLYSRSIKTELPAWRLVFRFIFLSSSLGLSGYGLFLAGWWLPIGLPLASMLATVSIGFGYRNQQLQNLAAYDELTQVPNRRYFDQYLAHSLKANKGLSLILCDVDYFKAFNDLYGHPAGDRCLYQVAQAIKIAVRDADLVARYGGEEFVIVLPEADESGAITVAKRIQAQIQQTKILHEGSFVSRLVTLSGGLIHVPKGVLIAPDMIVEHADKALYEAKQTGRNKIMMSKWLTSNDKGMNWEEAA
ncbi:MAG: CHASE2 domain-containing protein [Cyanobacteria bacterium J06621_11]